MKRALLAFGIAIPFVVLTVAVFPHMEPLTGFFVGFFWGSIGALIADQILDSV